MRVFTLILTILLMGFGIIMFTSLGVTAMNYLVAAGLIVYIVLVLVDNVLHYRGRIQIFAIFELMLITMLAAGLFVPEFNVLGISGVNASLGFAMWIRAIVEVLHGYFLQGSDGKLRFSLFKMILCIAFLSLGVAILCSPLINEQVLRWGVGCFSIFGSLVMAWVTSRNRAEKRKRAKKDKKTDKK